VSGWAWDRARGLRLQHRSAFGYPPDRSNHRSPDQHSGHRILNFRSGVRVHRRRRSLFPALFRQYRTRRLLPPRKAPAISACIPPFARARLGWNPKIQPEEVQLGNRGRCKTLRAALALKILQKSQTAEHGTQYRLLHAISALLSLRGMVVSAVEYRILKPFGDRRFPPPGAPRADLDILRESAVLHLSVQRRPTEAGAFLYGFDAEDAVGSIGLR